MPAAVSGRSLRIVVSLLTLAALSSVSLPAQSASARAAFAAGNAAMRSGRAAEAVTDFERFTREEPDSAIGYFNLGLALEQAARLDDSLAALHQAQSLDPSLHGVQLFTGIVAYKLNRLSESQAALVRATHTEPDNASAWMWLGVTELAQNQPDAAAAALDHAARLDPKNADILYHRGRAHLLVSKESYDAMYALDPNSWRVHEVLAQSDAEALRTEDAIQEFQAAIRVAPTEPGLHEQLGDAFWTDGKLQQADAAYSAELAIDPHNALVKYKLGSLRVTNNQAERGIPLLKQALSGDPTLVDAHYYLGKGFDEEGQQAAAVEQFRRAIAGNGSEDLHIMSWYRLASLYRQMHQPEEAAHALAMFRQMRQARNQRQEVKFQTRKNRDQLPEQEKIPGSAAQ